MNCALAVLLVVSMLGQPAATLEPGKPQERELRANETHSYKLTLQTGQFVRGIVEQRGISINVRGIFPDGSKIRSFNGPALGVKRFRFVAEQPGEYSLELKAAPESQSGSYRIEIQEIQSMSERLRVVREEANSSPRINVLRAELDRGNRDALDHFWREMATRATPLVEPLERDKENLLVTFLWRAAFETHNVLVMWDSYTVNHLDDFQMSRLGDTDLWYKSLPVPKGARFTYQLSPNDTLSRASNAQRYATAQADPLNPKRRPDNPNLTKYEAFSIAELPGATPQPWLQVKEAAPGKIERHRFKSEMLNNERVVLAYTPHDYPNKQAPYPLLVLFDGPDYVSLGLKNTLDNLIAAGRIRPLVAVLVDNLDSDTRTRELACNQKFADFLHGELLPWVRRSYQVTASASDVIIGGKSHGGLGAVYAALTHPESFGNVICQSGTLWYVPGQDVNAIRLRGGDQESNWVARQFIQSPKLPLRFFIEAGLFENDIWGSGGQILERSRHLRDVLLAKDYEVHYQDFPGGHDSMNWRGSIADALIALAGTTKVP
jgi:enterochelin esterase family protein